MAVLDLKDYDLGWKFMELFWGVSCLTRLFLRDVLLAERPLSGLSA